MSKILITGAGGQLGQCIQKKKEEHPFLDFLFTNSKDLDICDKASLKHFFNREKKIDYCINCAAVTNVDLLEEKANLAYLVNADGAYYLSEMCKANDTILIHISTDYVFDGTKTSPYLVDDITNPINVYGASKLKGENYIKEIMESYFIIRTSWLYSEFGHNFYKTVLGKMQKKEVLNVINDQMGCPTDANNLVQCILNLIETQSTDYGVHHFCGKKEMTWFSFAKHIADIHSIKATIHPVNSNYYKTLAKRPKYSILKRTIE